MAKVEYEYYGLKMRAEGSKKFVKRQSRDFLGYVLRDTALDQMAKKGSRTEEAEG